MDNNNPDSRRCARQGRLALIIVLSVLVVDQIVKMLVKTNMHLGQSIEIASWFQILFVENNGMAFGMEIIGKLFLSLFRILAIGFFVWYLIKILDKGFPTGYIVTVSFVVAGALGNLIDCMFYGLIFTQSSVIPQEVASFTSFGDGYAPFLYGKVVDMFYFPLWTWPDWMPLIGGDIFFSPVFNVADSCITCGVIALLLFYTRLVNMGLHYNENADSVNNPDKADEKE
jgi:signal peptidase II